MKAAYWYITGGILAWLMLRGKKAAASITPTQPVMDFAKEGVAPHGTVDVSKFIVMSDERGDHYWIVGEGEVTYEEWARRRTGG